MESSVDHAAMANERRLLAEIKSVKDEMTRLRVKEMFASKEAMADGGREYRALRGRVAELERENATVLKTAVDAQRDAAGQGLLARLRHDKEKEGMQDTEVQQFAMQLRWAPPTACGGGGGGGGEADVSALDQAAEELATSLERSGAQHLTAGERELLASVQGVLGQLDLSADDDRGKREREARARTQAEQRIADEKLDGLLMAASAESAVVQKTKAAVVAARTHSAWCMERAEQLRQAAAAHQESAQELIRAAQETMLAFGRSEAKEIRAIRRPTPPVIRLMGAIRLLLNDPGGAEWQDVTPLSAVPEDWSAVDKMLADPRFIARLVSVTRLYSDVPADVINCVTRGLGSAETDMQGLAKLSMAAANLARWLQAFLEFRHLQSNAEGAQEELRKVEGMIEVAASDLRGKELESQRVEQTAVAQNERIKGLMSMNESLPRKQEMRRFYELKTMRSTMQSMEREQVQLLKEVQETLPPKFTGDRGTKALPPPKPREDVAIDARVVLGKLKMERTKRSGAMRDRLEKLEQRQKAQAAFTERATSLAVSDDVGALEALLDEATVYNEMHPWPDGQVLVVDTTDQERRTPLHYSACHGSFEASSLLLASGADAFAEDSAGFTALHFAAAHNQKNVAALLATDPSARGAEQCARPVGSNGAALGLARRLARHRLAATADGRRRSCRGPQRADRYGRCSRRRDTAADSRPFGAEQHAERRRRRSAACHASDGGCAGGAAERRARGGCHRGGTRSAGDEGKLGRIPRRARDEPSPRRSHGAGSSGQRPALH